MHKCQTAHVCVSLYTTVEHNTAQSSSDYLPSYPLGKHQSSDAVFWTGMGFLLNIMKKIRHYKINKIMYYKVITINTSSSLTKPVNSTISKHLLPYTAVTKKQMLNCRTCGNFLTIHSKRYNKRTDQITFPQTVRTKCR